MSYDPTSLGIVVVKTSDESVTSSVVEQLDDHLAFEAEANSNYQVDYFLKVHSLSVVPDFDWNLDVPTGCEWMAGGHYKDQSTGGGTGIVTRNSEGHAGTTLINVGDSSVHTWIRLIALVRTSTTAGTVTLEWAQDVSNAIATTVHAGSWLRAQRIGANT